MVEKVVQNAAEQSFADKLPPVSVEHQILDFVDGRSDGAALLDALYGDTLDELLPARLTDLLRDWRVM